MFAVKRRCGQRSITCNKWYMSSNLKNKTERTNLNVFGSNLRVFRLFSTLNRLEFFNKVSLNGIFFKKKNIYYYFKNFHLNTNLINKIEDKQFHLSTYSCGKNTRLQMFFPLLFAVGGFWFNGSINTPSWFNNI